MYFISVNQYFSFVAFPYNGFMLNLGSVDGVDFEYIAIDKHGT